MGDTSRMKLNYWIAAALVLIAWFFAAEGDYFISIIFFLLLAVLALGVGRAKDSALSHHSGHTHASGQHSESLHKHSLNPSQGHPHNSPDSAVSQSPFAQVISQFPPSRHGDVRAEEEMARRQGHRRLRRETDKRRADSGLEASKGGKPHSRAEDGGHLSEEDKDHPEEEFGKGLATVVAWPFKVAVKIIRNFF
ncbi:hypothetical protein HY095_03300 [Candidatus Micrarchaeota archaeon]|nr:hypothetical protein [Candidatus Micrarchaeota archaeon]